MYNPKKEMKLRKLEKALQENISQNTKDNHHYNYKYDSEKNRIKITYK